MTGQIKRSAPNSRKHRNDLLLAAHDAGQIELVVVRFSRECISDRIVTSDIEEIRTLNENVCEHEKDHVIAVLFLEHVHGLKELGFAFEH